MLLPRWEEPVVLRELIIGVIHHKSDMQWLIIATIAKSPRGLNAFRSISALLDFLHD